MGENKLKTRTKFELTIQEMLNIQGHCNVLKDFVHISFEDGLMLQKNVSIIKKTFEELNSKGELLDERTKSLNKEAIKLHEENIALNKRSTDGENGKTLQPDREKLNTSQEKLTKDREDNEKKIKEYNLKKHVIQLNTISLDSFPKERAKYDKKTISNGQQSQEVERYASFLELVGTIIPEPAEE